MKYVYRLLLSLIFLSLFSVPVFAQTNDEFFGTTEPYAEEAIYFVLTDRFVDGDENNNFVDQGGNNRSFDRPLFGPNGQRANVGYLGGDFKGILDNADYIRDMGFTSVWITPIVDNPDEAFTGGNQVTFNGSGDGGKTGYHGYWGVNFYKVDEHLESQGGILGSELTFRDFTRKMRDDHGLKIVLDIVCNHGSPSFDMRPFDQPKYAEIYDENDSLVADHQNLFPHRLDPNNPLHLFFHRLGDIAQLSNLNENNDDVINYMVGAYLKWIDRGAAAFRIDTIKHMPHSFWKKFTDRIRAEHPGFFMFAESFSFDANFIAQHTRPENGGVSVLDFPGRQHILNVFQNPNRNYADILGYLHLEDGTYENPYELATFYDNHDVTRMNASHEGFIDAHNWLFTSRGIPVVYYGSEVAFMAGTREHEGNRNFFGQENVNRARNHKIYKGLEKIAHIRKASPALQKGLQINLVFSGNRASFYRVYQRGGTNQTALVLLNKGFGTENFTVNQFVSAGTWTDGHTGDTIEVTDANREISTSVGPHDVKVLLFNKKVNHTGFIGHLCRLMGREDCPTSGFKTRFPRGELRLTGQEFSNWNPANNQYVLKLVGDHEWETEVPVLAAFSDIPYKITFSGSWDINWGGGASGNDTFLSRTGVNATVSLRPITYNLEVTEGNNINSPIHVRWRAKEEPSKVPISFTCHNGQTFFGQSVYVVGSVRELGVWNPAGAVKLEPTNYPTWTGTIPLPANTEIEWKCLKRCETNPNECIVWQHGGNNILNTPGSGSGSATAGF